MSQAEKARQKLQAELERVQGLDLKLWITVREQANEEVSKEHSMFCVCGKLCTGLHESYCRKFKEKVWRRAIKKFDEQYGGGTNGGLLQSKEKHD